MKSGDELIVTYKINNRAIDIYGCWDEDTPENEFDFYDAYETNPETNMAECLNLGCPFYERPTKTEIEEFLRDNKL